MIDLDTKYSRLQEITKGLMRAIDMFSQFIKTMIKDRKWKRELNLVVQAYNPSTQEAEVWRLSQVQGHPSSYGEHCVKQISKLIIMMMDKEQTHGKLK